MVYLLYWLITPRKTPRVCVHDENQETWSRLSHQNHSPSLLPWFVTPSGALSSQMPSCGMDTVVLTAAVGYHQPPAGIAVLTLKVVRARVCRTRRAAGFRAVHEAATFRIVASAGSGGHLLAVLLLRFLGVLRARPKHMITWGELKLAGPNGARAAWFRLRERRGGTHRHGNRVSMSCARCSQSSTLFPEATSCIKAQNSRPPIQ